MKFCDMISLVNLPENPVSKRVGMEVAQYWHSQEQHNWLAGDNSFNKDALLKKSTLATGEYNQIHM